MTQPFDMIIIGATGDLARRKLVPALYNLHHFGALSGDGRIFAIGRSEGDSETFLTDLEAAVREHVKQEVPDETWREFAKRFRFTVLEATDASTYGELRKALQTPDQKMVQKKGQENGQNGRENDERVRIFYLATPPGLYGDISQALSEVGLVTPATRIVLEKPIGSDLESAREINRRVGRHFREDQIYRIDHYLGKETVQNLMALRFSNALFEPLWRSEHIDHVQITVAETLGVEGRGAYYDKAGALRDMVQNHLLQLLCLTAMEPPGRLDQDSIREEKIKVLRALRPMSIEDVARKTVRAQYRDGLITSKTKPPKEVKGYLEEDGIDPKSHTETFVALKAEVDNWRWAGVPFYLRTGKRMGHKVSEIILQFKKVPHLLFSGEADAMQENRLVIRLQPDESIKLGLMIKVPGSKMELKRVHLNLNLAETYQERRPPLAYERLLMDVIRGNATLFMHRDEVEAAWKWIEPIHDAWDERGERPRVYTAGTWGPTESLKLIVRDDREWFEHLVDPR